MDACGHGLRDVPVNTHISFEDLSDRIHPTDRDRVRAASSATAIGSWSCIFRVEEFV